MLRFERENYIFYISDMETLPDTGHFRKMEKEKEIAEHINRGIGECTILKSTDYDGEVICADSVGIVFPLHSFGISLAVYSFLSGLRISETTYVYAIVAGEKIDISYKMKNHSNLNSFIRLFEKKGFGTKEDVFVRLKNMKRTTEGTEESIRYSSDMKERIVAIMKGLLFYSLGDVDSVAALPESRTKNNRNQVNSAFDIVDFEDAAAETVRTKSFTLSNVFLDENMLAGVRLCRVM